MYRYTGQRTPVVMLPVLILLCLVGRSQGQFIPWLGRTDGPNIIGFQSGPGINFGNGFQGMNGPFMPNFADGNFGPGVMPNFVDGNVGPFVMSNFVDNNIGPAVTPNFVGSNFGPVVIPNGDANIGSPGLPNIVDANIGQSLIPNINGANFGPDVMPNINGANFGPAVMPNINGANFGPAVMPNINGANFGPDVMQNINGANFGPDVMPNINGADIGPIGMPNIDGANIGPAGMPNINNANIGLVGMPNINNANIGPVGMPNINNANIGPVGMPNINDANIGPVGMPNINGANIGPAATSNLNNADIGQAVRQNVNNANFGPDMLPNGNNVNFGPAVMPNDNAANIGQAVNRNINDANVGPAAMPNLPRQNVLQTAATSNQQGGLAGILPFPQVIPQIPDLPRISVPNSQTNSRAFDDFGQQISNQQERPQNTNAANRGGAAFVNFAQRPLDNRFAPINRANGVQPIQAVDNRGQVPMLPLRNFRNANRDVSLNTPGVMPAMPTFNSVEGRFNAGLDFNDPRIRTPSRAAAAAAAAATSTNGQRANNNGLGQNLVPQNIGFNAGIGQNFEFDQNLARGPGFQGFQGGVNLEPGFRFPGDGFQFNQPEPFPFSARPVGFNDDGFQTFNPGPQLSDFNGFRFGGPLQGGITSPAPFDANSFPGLSFPDQTGTNFLGGNNLILNDFGFNNFPTDAGFVQTFAGNDVRFPGGPVMTA